jgi:hypothetical protein
MMDHGSKTKRPSCQLDSASQQGRTTCYRHDEQHK